MKSERSTVSVKISFFKRWSFLGILLGLATDLRAALDTAQPQA